MSFSSSADLRQGLGPFCGLGYLLSPPSAILGEM